MSQINYLNLSENESPDIFSDSEAVTSPETTMFTECEKNFRFISSLTKYTDLNKSHILLSTFAVYSINAKNEIIRKDNKPNFTLAYDTLVLFLVKDSINFWIEHSLVLQFAWIHSKFYIRRARRTRTHGRLARMERDQYG